MPAPARDSKAGRVLAAVDGFLKDPVAFPRARIGEACAACPVETFIHDRACDGLWAEAYACFSGFAAIPDTPDGRAMAKLRRFVVHAWRHVLTEIMEREARGELRPPPPAASGDLFGGTDFKSRAAGED